MQRYKSTYTGVQIDAAIDRAKAGGEIDASLSNKLTVNASITDMDTTITPGVYTVDGNTANKPWGLYDATLLVYPSSGWENQAITQILIDNSNRKQAFRSKNYGANAWVWTSWTPFATATPPTEYDLPLASGYTTIDGCTCFKTQDSVVTVIGNINHTGGFTGLSQIAELPIEYRPAKTKISSYGTYAGGYGGGIIFYPNGVVCLAQDLPVEAIYFSATFAAAN